MKNEITMTVKEAAEYLGISYGSMSKITKREDFPVLYVGRKVLIPREAFYQWFQNERGNKNGTAPHKERSEDGTT